MPEQVSQRADFLYKSFVDKNIRQLVEEQTILEQMMVHQSVGGLNIRYYREQYLDIETPNDASMSSPVDDFLRSPGYRAPGANFPHTSFGEPKEYNLGLYQVGLETDIPDEQTKYVEMQNTPLKAQTKLSNAFASKINTILTNKVTDNWATASSLIQNQTVSSGKEWSQDPTTSGLDPIGDILGAIEKVEDISGYNYKATALMVSKQTAFDLRRYFAYTDYTTKEIQVGAETKVESIEGVPMIVSNMIKRDFAVVADMKAAGTLFEAEPMNINTYRTENDRQTHIQISRTFNFALTDPKAVCLIVNTVA